MNEGLIPSRYAKALHLYAEEAGKAAAVYEQTERLAAGYEAHPQMSRAVENPFLPLADKQQLLLVASGAENDGCLDKFFKLVFKYTHHLEVFFLNEFNKSFFSKSSCKFKKVHRIKI